MKKRIILWSLLFSLGLFFTACDDTDNEDTHKEEKVSLNVDNNSLSLTANRVVYKNEPLFNPEYDAAYNGSEVVASKSAKLLERGEMFVLIADVASPVRSGERTLSATHVSLNNYHAYVSYHYNEPNDAPSSQDLYEGQVEILDVSNPTKPVIKAAATTDVADFNTMNIDYSSNDANQTLWIGATDFNIGGAIYELNLTNNELDANSVLIRHKAKDGHSVNGIVRASDYLFASAGRSSGGSYMFDTNSMNLLHFNAYKNAKYVVATGTDAGEKLVVLTSGENAQLLVYAIDEDMTLLNTINLGTIEPETGKSVIYVKDGLCWVSMGYAGLKAFDLVSGEIVHTLTITGPAVTNGVAMDDDFIYVANGTGGMYICEAIEGQQELDVLEVYNYGASANYINVQNNLIFIANGREGLKILRRLPKGEYQFACDYDDDGVPVCLTQNDVCDNLRNNINLMLPEYKNARTTHPEYFTYPTSIVLEKEATVYVSFIDEGAAFKNSFGMYTHHINYLPDTPDELYNRQIIYPNASKKGAGGQLIPGATIKMLGTYEAGTSIGGFVLANAWVGKDKVEGGVKEGYYAFYSEPTLNSGNYQQSLVFYDQECDAIVLTFEDVKISGGDKDYNDCIMQISVEPADAVDVSQFIQIVKE